MSNKNSSKKIPEERIIEKIYFIRGEKVMLDTDLAELYGVATKVFNQAIKRNSNRFPKDFMFRLDNKEFTNLKSQIVTSSWGGRRKLPYVFTEQGVAMLSGVLNSSIAIDVNIQIIRIFIRMRKMLNENLELFMKLEKMEKQLFQNSDQLNKHEEEIQIIFETIKQLISPERQEHKKIGYKRKDEE